MLITRLLLVLEVWDGKPTYRKSWAGNVFVRLDLTLDPFFRVLTRILHLQYFFKYVLAYFLHLNNYLVTFLHNPICGAQLICPSVSFGISFEHAVQLPFTVLLYSTFPDNYAFLSLSPSQIKNTHSADTVPVHRHSTLVIHYKYSYL